MKMDEKATCRTYNLPVYKIIAICNHLIRTQPAASSRPTAQARLKLIQNTSNSASNGASQRASEGLTEGLKRKEKGMVSDL